MQIPSAPKTAKVNTWLLCFSSLKNKNGSERGSSKTVTSIEVYPDPYSDHSNNSKRTVGTAKDNTQSIYAMSRYSSPYLEDKIVIKQVKNPKHYSNSSNKQDTCSLISASLKSSALLSKTIGGIPLY